MVRLPSGVSALARCVAGLALGGACLLAAGAVAARAEGGEGGADIVLITVDTLRADAVDLGRGGGETTPGLARLAASGRVFSRAYAHNVVTLPSHANILTGLYPYQHGIRDNAGFRLPPSIPTLAEILAEGGFATGAFVAAFPLDSQFGLDRGFQVYVDRYPEGSRPTEFVLPERRGSEVVADAGRWWEENQGHRRFLWLHLFDPHAPYDPPEPWASRFAEAPYRGEVALVDALLTPLLEPLLAAGEPAAWIVFTADHGEALGDHGELTHGLFAYEPTLKVPLVLWGPGVEPGIDDRLARHVDLFPTLAEAAGLQPEPGRPGRSLLRPATGSEVSYFEALSAALNRAWAPLRGLLRGPWKLIDLPLPELYDLQADPEEKRNLADERAELARELAAMLPADSEWPVPRDALEAGEREGLESLGYLTGSPPQPQAFRPEDDPKRLVDLDRRMHQVIDLYSRGEMEEAVNLARGVVEERPEMPMGHSLLAQALLESGRRPEAVAVMERARSLGLASDSLLRQLGLSLAESGRAVEAIELLKPLAAGGDLRSHNALALALSEAGRQDEAMALLRSVVADDPDNPKAYEQMGLVALRLGRWQEARERSRQALELNPSLPLAWNNLGVALYRLRDALGAVEAWARAVALDPMLFDALYNLGTVALEIGRVDLAREALTRFVNEAPEAAYRGDLMRARVLLRRLQSEEGASDR